MLHGNHIPAQDQVHYLKTLSPQPRAIPATLCRIRWALLAYLVQEPRIQRTSVDETRSSGYRLPSGFLGVLHSLRPMPPTASESAAVIPHRRASRSVKPSGPFV